MPIDYVLINGNPVFEGSNDTQTVKASGKEVSNTDLGSFVYENGITVDVSNPFTLQGPIDIAVTCDNLYDFYADSLDNQIIDHTDSDGEWETTEKFTDLSIPDGASYLGIQVWNGDEGWGNRPSTDDGTDPWMFCFTIRDSDGSKYPVTVNTTFTVDGQYVDENPYGTDWVAEGFDDSAWTTNVGNTRTATEGWSSLNDDGTSAGNFTYFDESQFFDTDPSFGNHLPSDEDPRQDANPDGFWFVRIPLEKL